MAAKSRYEMGVHILVLLAIEPDKMKTSHELAKDLSVNPVVVRRILSGLHKGGLIKSSKGPTGGSRLAHSPKSITLGDAYKALLPGPLFHAPAGGRAETARLQSVLGRHFQSAQEALEEQLGDTTLAQILKKLAKTPKKQEAE
jgi:Rrf2 family protein